LFVLLLALVANYLGADRLRSDGGVLLLHHVRVLNRA
jgi:hypothetical protein